MRPAVVRSAFVRNQVAHGHILLLDCGAEERERRLHGPRGQPELATVHKISWAAYLRGQADALQVPVLDTTSLTPEAALGRLLEHSRALMATV
jgi:hypothetical protein